MKEITFNTPLGATDAEQQHKRLHRWHQVRHAVSQFLGHVIILAMGMFFIIPFFWMLVTSFKDDKDVFRTPPSWLPHASALVTIDGKELPLYDVEIDGQTKQLALVTVAEGLGDFVDPQNPSQVYNQVRMKFAQPILQVGLRWRNYIDAMSRATRPGLGVNFLTYFRNSLIIAFFTILGTLLSNSPVAYAFARIKFPGREMLFIFVLATMMLPYQVTMIPLYLYFNDTLHWGDSFLPLIIPAFFANAYDVFLLRQFFRTIPVEMADAARVDGASELDIFLTIVLPLSVPVLATVTVFTFLYAWNDFQGPLLYLTSPQNFTMSLGLQDFKSQRTVAWNLLMAASVVFTIPIIIAFFFAQKTFIQGIKLTGLKE